MVELGIAFSSEEHGPVELVRQAVLAERYGFRYAAISDHFHPWTERQGESPFVWAVLGGIATSTERLELTTMVTCPTMRLHPAIVAQAAATVGAIMPSRPGQRREPQRAHRRPALAASRRAHRDARRCSRDYPATMDGRDVSYDGL
ncbi:MAG TPA: LLM class flavin-dependent oxidoreductase [Dehalococcoidia bacterium]|nr:LLM class flavin-dependent oxidoreductase [Dehalococcoidia bacterium]